LFEGFDDVVESSSPGLTPGSHRSVRDSLPSYGSSLNKANTLALL
jgi:hypothetical protein